MATAVRRSGPAIRDALQGVSPGECGVFESEYRAALDRVRAELDLTPVKQVLNRWWGIAAIRVEPLEAHEQAQIARARSGDMSGLWEQDESGAWTQL